MRHRTSFIAGSDRRVQPPDTHAKRYTKKFGDHAVFLASLWCLLSTTEDWPPTTFALDITAVTRWWPPPSASQRAEPVWENFGIWQGASRALWGLSICAFGCFIYSVEKFGSTTEYWKNLKALVPSMICKCFCTEDLCKDCTLTCWDSKIPSI
jgi:hypothetical protein